MSVFHKNSLFHFSRQMFRGHFSTVSSIISSNILLINNAFNNDDNTRALLVYLETSATVIFCKHKNSQDKQFKGITILYYIKSQQDATLAVLFINHCKITLHISDAFCVHHHEYKNCSSSHWCMSWVGMICIQ